MPVPVLPVAVGVCSAATVWPVRAFEGTESASAVAMIARREYSMRYLMFTLWHQELGPARASESPAEGGLSCCTSLESHCSPGHQPRQPVRLSCGPNNVTACGISPDAMLLACSPE